MTEQIFTLELLIPVGGAGCRMLARTLHCAQRRLGFIPPSWRWIAIDSDARSAQLLPFANGQFILLRATDGAGILGQIKNGKLDHCLASLGEPTMLKQMRPGCQAQKTPRVGYLGGIFNAVTWESVLTETLQQYLPLEAPPVIAGLSHYDCRFDISKVHVKIFAGLSGGQGGGIHRQVATVLRSFAEREGFSARTFFTLYAALSNYSTNQKERERELANQGARVIELDLYQSSPTFRHDLSFPNRSRAQWAGRLYDMAQLFEQRTAGKTSGDEMADRIGQFVASSLIVPEIGEHLNSYVIANELENTAPVERGETGWINTGGYSEIALPGALDNVLTEHALGKIYSHHLLPPEIKKVGARTNRFMESILAEEPRELCARISLVYEGGAITQAITREIRRCLPRLARAEESLTRVAAITHEKISDWKFYGGASEEGLAKLRDAFAAGLEGLVNDMQAGVTREGVETMRSIIAAIDERLRALRQIGDDAVQAEESATVAFADAEADFQGTGSIDSFYAAVEAEERRATASAMVEATQIAETLLEEARQSLNQRLPACDRLLAEITSRRDRAERRAMSLVSALAAQAPASAFPLASANLLDNLVDQILADGNLQLLEQQVANALALSSPLEFALKGFGDDAELVLRTFTERLVRERLLNVTAAELFMLAVATKEAACREIRRLMALAECNLRVVDDYGRLTKRYGLIIVDENLVSAPLVRLLGEVKKEFRHWQIVHSSDSTAVRFHYLQTGIAPSLVPICQKALEALGAIPTESQRGELIEPGLEAVIGRKEFGRVGETNLPANSAFLMAGALGLVRNNGNGFTYKHSAGLAHLGSGLSQAIELLAYSDGLLTSLKQAISARLSAIGDDEALRRLRDFRAHLKKYYDVGPRDFPAAEDVTEVARWRNGHETTNSREQPLLKGDRNGSRVLSVQ